MPDHNITGGMPGHCKGSRLTYIIVTELQMWNSRLWRAHQIIKYFAFVTICIKQSVRQACKWLAAYVRRYGVKVSFDEIRKNPAKKDEICRFLRHDSKIRSVCGTVADDDFSTRRF